MSLVSLPPQPKHGQVITAAYLDSVFAAFTDVLNGKLDRSNFRARAGIRNQEKTSPKAWLPLTWGFRGSLIGGSNYCLALGPNSYLGPDAAGLNLFALPNYKQTTVGTDDGSVDPANTLKTPVALGSFQAIHTGIAYLHVGDTCTVQLTYRTYPGGVVQGTGLNLAAAAAGTLVTADLSGFGLVDYFFAALRMSTSAAAGVRWLLNPRVMLWTKAAHVG